MVLHDICTPAVIYLVFSLTQIVTNPYQPRKSIDPQTIEDLSASIVSEGLLQPIVVRAVH